MLRRDKARHPYSTSRGARPEGEEDLPAGREQTDRLARLLGRPVCEWGCTRLPAHPGRPRSGVQTVNMEGSFAFVAGRGFGERIDKVKEPLWDFGNFRDFEGVDDGATQGKVLFEFHFVGLSGLQVLDPDVGIRHLELKRLLACGRTAASLLLAERRSGNQDAERQN
jgi:hypothetical protein